MNPPLMKTTQAAPPRPGLFKQILLRVLLVLPFGVAGTLWWMSSGRLAPVSKESQELSQKASQLETAIGQLEQRRKDAESGRLAERYDAIFNRFFDGQESLTLWVDDLRQHAAALALDVRPDISELSVEKVAEESLQVIRVRLDVTPAVAIESNQSPYQRMLEFADYVHRHSRRADFQGLQVTGADGNAHLGRLELKLWGIPPKS